MIDNLNKKSSANKTGAGKIKFGGMNGGDSVISSLARIRYEAGIIQQATLLTAGDGVTVLFNGSNGEPLYEGKSHFLCHSSNLSQAMVFRNDDEAASFLKDLGFADQDILTS